jgi:hypothetical protein
MRQLTEAELKDFRHVPMVDRRRARIVTVPWLPPGTSAMTFGRWILMRRGSFSSFRRGLLGHELVHVMQWREIGVFKFMYLYSYYYLRGRFRGLGHWPAYTEVPYEIEARELSGY